MARLTRENIQEVLLRIYSQGSELKERFSRLEEVVNKIDRVYDELVQL